MPTTNLIDLDGVRYRWPGASGFAIEIPRLEMAAGDRMLLVGPSGSGKSTLLGLIAGIIAPDAGRIAILGTDVARLGPAARDRFRAEHLGIVFQMFNLLPYGSAIDNVLLALSFAPARRARVGNSGGQLAEARRLLGRLGLDPDRFGARRAAALSVGQQQRVAAARALIGGPELIIADEPTSALDPEIRDQFLDLLFAEAERARAGLLMVSHDPGLAAHFDRVVRLGDIMHDASLAAGVGA